MKFKSSLVLFLMVLALISGCNSSKLVENEDKSILEKNLKTILADSRSVDSGAMEVKLKGDLEIKEDEVLNVLNLDSEISANYRLADKVTRVRDLFLDLTVDYKSKEQSGNLTGNLLFLENSLYVLLSEVPSNLDDMPELAMFKGKWIKLALPPAIQNVPGFDSILKSSNLTGLSKEETALKDLYFNTNFYKEIKDNGTTTRNDKKVQSYSVEYDTNAIYLFYVNSAKITKEALSEKEKADLKALIDGLDLKMTYFIFENKLSALEGNIDLDFARENAEMDLDVTFTVELTDVVDESKFVVPADAVDLMQIMGNFN